jgi:hypothetical protein
MIPSSAAIAEYEEQVTSFLRRASSKAEGIAALNQHSSALLKDLRALLPVIEESPAYAGVAFYGRFQAVNLSLIKKLATANVAAVTALEEIRAAKALRVAASAKLGWDILFKENPGALWAAIYLNLCVKTASVRVAAVRDEDGEVDEDYDDQLEDDDDAN